MCEKEEKRYEESSGKGSVKFTERTEKRRFERVIEGKWSFD